MIIVAIVSVARMSEHQREINDVTAVAMLAMDNFPP